MRIEGRLGFGRFRSRPNRFTVVLETPKGTRRCHLRDPGRLTEILIPGARTIFLERSGPGRKTDCEVLAVWSGTWWTVVNSGLHTDLATELILSGAVPELPADAPIRREVRFGDSRVDLLLDTSPPTLVEVKGCTLVVDGVALFPDAPTERGTRHVLNLIRAVRSGMRAAVLFLVMRPDAERLEPNEETDPKFAEALRSARREGVALLAHRFRLRGRVIEPVGGIPVVV